MRSSLTPRRLAVALVGLLVVATGGGAVLLADEPPRSLPAAADGVAEQYRSLDGFNGTRVQVVSIGNDTRRTVQRVSLRPGTGAYRAVTLNRTGSTGVAFDVTVSNGTVTWFYDRENESVQRVSLADSQAFGYDPAQLERLVTAAVDGTEVEPSDISLLPSVSRSGAGGSGPGLANLSAQQVSVRYTGTERVNDRRTYVLALTAEEPRLSNFSTRLWLDAEWFVPLRVSNVFTADGTRYETRIRYRSLTFDPGLENVSFRFEVPENATLVDGPQLSSFDSRAALARNTTLPVPDPEVPDGFALRDASQTVSEFRSATLRYSNGTGRLSVTVVNDTEAVQVVEGATVEIGDRTGRLTSFGPGGSVGWSCDDRGYLVGGTVDNESLLDVARSVGCG
jgi:outer membrane lipoprotein-sorting protein